MKLIRVVYHHFFRAAVLVTMALGSGAQALGPGGLRCESVVNPLGIDVLQPRLSWTMEERSEGGDQNAERALASLKKTGEALTGMAEGKQETRGQRPETGGQNSKSKIQNPKFSFPRGVRQTAYQVVVNDAWDSGKVASDASVNVEYAGKPLESGRRYTWKVRVWDQDGKLSSWSANAHWTMGLLKPEDWTAQWISTEVTEPAPVSGGMLKILKAAYVAKDGSGSADVTARVADKVKDGGLNLMVQPDQLGGDPVPNHAKELRVEYEFNGKKMSAAAVDFRTLTLPPRSSRVPAPLDAPYIRRTFTLDAVPKSARITVNVLGFYELYVNGAKVGADVLSPALSNYHKRSLYVTYDLLPYLRKGRNCIGLWTGRGWYWKVLDGRANPAVKHDTAIARVQLDMVVNGKPVRIGTGADWRCKASGRSILGTWSWNAMGGELVDARLEDPKWADPASNDASWYPVTVVPAPAIPAEAQKCPPTRVIKTLPAVDCISSQSGRYELDFGSNLTGGLRLRMRGLKAGDEIVIRYSDKKGHAPMQLYNHEDRFISAGRPEEEFCSKFNYHGFRWALIDGLPAAPRLKDAQALALGSDWESCGGFECSSKLFNRMHEVNLWTVRALSQCGFLSDCPHRERAGYGDGQVSIESCMMNFRMQGFYDKWATDWCDGADPATGYLPHTAPQYQFGGGGPGWGGAAQALTWRNYLYYDDRRILARNYEACRRHIEAIESHAKDGIVRSYGGQWDFIGDWVPPERGLDTSNWPPKPAAEFFNNCYRLYLREQLATMADVLGRPGEARTCRTELERLRPLVHAAFYDKERQIYVLDEQSYQLMPLMTGVVPADLRPAILKKLEDGIRVNRKGHLDTGMLGTYFLLQYLQQAGRNDLIFEVVNQTTYPGWGHMIEQGATTWWEQWNGYWSQIHSCFTSLDAWFYQGLAGIRPDPTAPGFKKFGIRPAVVGDLTWVKAHYDSAYGRIGSAWSIEGAALVMDVAVPPNSSATVHVPAADQGSVTVAGQATATAPGVRFQRMEAGAAVYAVQSGRYSFRSKR